MLIGQRIKRARLHRGLTQKELGMMIGYDAKSADVRIAQYESSARTPKAGMRDKLSAALNVNPRYLNDLDLSAAEDIMILLFELDSRYGLDISAAGTIRASDSAADSILSAWMEQKKALADGKITKREYTEWALTWPASE